jgi:hypothetical protein
MFTTPGSRAGRKTANRLRQGYFADQLPPRTVAAGTFKPDPRVRNIQYVINGGAFTLDPPAEWCTVIIDVLNNASAGTVTTSNWTKVEGATLDTTNGRGWRGVGSVGPLGSHLIWTRLV